MTSGKSFSKRDFLILCLVGWLGVGYALGGIVSITLLLICEVIHPDWLFYSLFSVFIIFFTLLTFLTIARTYEFAGIFEKETEMIGGEENGRSQENFN